MRKALTQVDPSATAKIDALKDVVLLTIKYPIGDLCDSLRYCQATISHAETVIEQLQHGLNHSDDFFLHLVQQFLDTAMIQASAAQSAVAQAMESTQLTLNFLGVDMKPTKVLLSFLFLLCYSLLKSFFLQKAGSDDENFAALYSFLNAWVAAERDIVALNGVIPATVKQSTPQWLVKASSIFFFDTIFNTMQLQ